MTLGTWESCPLSPVSLWWLLLFFFSVGVLFLSLLFLLLLLLYEFCGLQIFSFRTVSTVNFCFVTHVLLFYLKYDFKDQRHEVLICVLLQNFYNFSPYLHVSNLFWDGFYLQSEIKIQLMSCVLHVGNDFLHHGPLGCVLSWFLYQRKLTVIISKQDSSVTFCCSHILHCFTLILSSLK